MIYLFFGKDTFRAKKTIEKIIERYKKIYKSGLNLKIIDLKEKNLFDLKQEFQSVSMFNEKKLFLLKNASKNSLFREKFSKEIKNLSSSKDIFIFFEEEEKLKGEFWDLIKKLARVVEFKPFDIKKTKIWAKNQFKKYQTEIEPTALDLLIKIVGNNLWQLDQAIKKLVAFKKQKSIKKEDIEKVFLLEGEVDIFKTIDAVAAGKTKEAIFFLKQHLEKGERANSLISLIKIQFKNILFVKDLTERNIPFYEIKKITQLHPYVLEKCLFLSRRFNLETLKRIYQKIFDIETKIRVGKLDAETGLFLLFLYTR